jgi:hypothetical protein
MSQNVPTTYQVTSYHEKTIQRPPFAWDSIRCFSSTLGRANRSDSNQNQSVYGPVNFVSCFTRYRFDDWDQPGPLTSQPPFPRLGYTASSSNLAASMDFIKEVIDTEGACQWPNKLLELIL